MNKYAFRRWIAFGILTLLFSIIAFRAGYLYGLNKGFDIGVEDTIERLEAKLVEEHS